MIENSNSNFKRIELAIRYIRDHFQEQPNLDEVAEQINLSPFHFQRLFTTKGGTCRRINSKCYTNAPATSRPKIKEGVKTFSLHI